MNKTGYCTRCTAFSRKLQRVIAVSEIGENWLCGICRGALIAAGALWPRGRRPKPAPHRPDITA